MVEEKEQVEKKAEKKSLLWLWILIGIIIVAGVLIWIFAGNKDEVSTDTEKVEEVVKHPDWAKFTAQKYAFTISHPAEYTVSESAVGNLIFKKADAEIVDMYVVSAAGSDEATVMKNQEDLFMTTERGLMTADEAIQIKTAGLTATQVNGVFGKNGGINLSHEGVAGTAVFFIQDDKLFVFDSYDKGVETDRVIFQDMVDSIKF